jgi:hypothetical protein
MRTRADWSPRAQRPFQACGKRTAWRRADKRLPTATKWLRSRVCVEATCLMKQRKSSPKRTVRRPPCGCRGCLGYLGTVRGRQSVAGWRERSLPQDVMGQFDARGERAACFCNGSSLQRVLFVAADVNIFYFEEQPAGDSGPAISRLSKASTMRSFCTDRSRHCRQRFFQECL